MASLAPRVTLALLVLTGAASLLSCGEAQSPADRILLQRQKFEVRMLSWAPLPDGKIALDLQVQVTGQNELESLTVLVQQVDADQEVIQEDRLPLDIRGIPFDGQKALTVHVPAAGDALDALAVLLENVPPQERRGDYPEFSGS